MTNFAFKIFKCFLYAAFQSTAFGSDGANRSARGPLQFRCHLAMQTFRSFGALLEKNEVSMDILAS